MSTILNMFYCIISFSFYLRRMFTVISNILHNRVCAISILFGIWVTESVQYWYYLAQVQQRVCNIDIIWHRCNRECAILILFGTGATESVQYWYYLEHVQQSVQYRYYLERVQQRECAISILFGTYGIQDLNW
jgi:hypothetical protein